MSTATHSTTAGLESFVYDDAIVRKFTLATIIWGIVGMLVGVIIALEMVNRSSESRRSFHPVRRPPHND